MIVNLVKADQSKFKGEPSFYVVRSILQTASYMEFVDPYTMGLLVKCHAGALNCTS